MEILQNPIPKTEFKKSEFIFDGPMVKAVVDVKNQIIAVDADLHADLEQLLLDNNASQDNLWGINLWFEDEGEDLIEFDSMINVRPRQGNRTRDVEDPETRSKIQEIVEKWIS